MSCTLCLRRRPLVALPLMSCRHVRAGRTTSWTRSRRRRDARTCRGMPALGWFLVIFALAPAAGLVPPHREPPGRHLQQRNACRRTARLVAQEGPRLTHGWSLRLDQQQQRYQAALEASPMRTQMATAALLAGFGDAIAQRLEGTNPNPHPNPNPSPSPNPNPHPNPTLNQSTSRCLRRRSCARRPGEGRYRGDVGEM